MDQDIVDYISQAEKHGLSEFEIKQNLLNAGWEAEVVEQSFVFAKAQENKIIEAKEIIPQTPHQTPPKPIIKDPHLSITEQTFSDVPPAHTQVPKRKNVMVWVVVIILLALGGSAFGYYQFIYSSPKNVWEKFTQTPSNPIYTNKFSVAYNDPGETDADAMMGFFGALKNIKLEISGDAYVNTENIDASESKSKISYTFATGSTSFSTGLEYSFLGNVLYLNVEDNPLLNTVSTEMNDGKKIQWLKIDLNELQKKVDQQGDAALLQQLTSTDFKNELQKLWHENQFIKQEQSLGTETVSGQTTVHFKNSLDKTALKNLINNYLDSLSAKLENTNNKISKTNLDTTKEVFSQLIDKLEIKEFESWIGKTDHQLYKVKFVSNAPSITSLLNNSKELSNIQSNSERDARRLMDVRMMASALEIYHKETGGYPDGKDGKPIGITPNYIGVIPTAPTPADGTCTDYFNGYWYKPMGTKKVVGGVTYYSSYQLTACFGSSVAGYEAGIAKLTPERGIIANIPCPATPELCSKPATDNAEETKKLISKYISKLDYSAQITINSEYSNYGKKEVVEAPSESFDLVKTFSTTQEKADDAKRLSDIRRMATTLELYFNEHNEYPKNLDELVNPNLLTEIPVAPKSSSTACNEEDNTYKYTRISSDKYTLTFCLTATTGGYSWGKHTLTQTGIQ